MTTNLQIDDPFPDAVLPDQDGRFRQLSSFTQPSPIDRKLGFNSGYPLIVVFYRGFYCPRDNAQMRQLVAFQEELRVNYAQLVTISVQQPLVQAAFRAGLGARWPFLADEPRNLIKQLNILDETEGEYAYPAQPYTFVLRPDLTIYKIYNGWFYVGRPTNAELSQDLRAIMETLPNYGYEAYNTPRAKQIRIPQQEWLAGTPPLGASGLPVVSGKVVRFSLSSGNGVIEQADGTQIDFNFTAVPGEGYATRTLSVGTRVQFELVEGDFGLAARNIQPILWH